MLAAYAHFINSYQFEARSCISDPCGQMPGNDREFMVLTCADFQPWFRTVCAENSLRGAF